MSSIYIKRLREFSRLPVGESVEITGVDDMLLSKEACGEVEKNQGWTFEVEAKEEGQTVFIRRVT